MTTINSYRELAARENAQAAEATLANVRERHARAAAAWTVLADRADHTSRMRIDREDAKLARESAEQASALEDEPAGIGLLDE